MKKHALITNVYSYKNKGDATIVLALIHDLKRVLDPSTITLQTTDIINDKGKYPHVDNIGPTLLWALFSSVREKSLIYRLCYLFITSLELCLSSMVYFITRKITHIGFNSLIKEYLNQINDSSYVIACGGGYLRSKNSGAFDTLLLLATCVNFLTPKVFGKKVYLYSQSIGPVYGNIQKKILSFSLNHVDLILAREDITFKYLQDLNIKTEYKLVSDSAFVYANARNQANESKFSLGDALSEDMNIGFTVRFWFKDEKKQEEYEKSVANTIDYLFEKYRAKSFYFPQVIAEGFGDDDRVSALRVKEYVKNKEAIEIVDMDLHPSELFDFAGEMFAFIGTRMHSNILSLISKTPVVAIEYEFKTRGIMRNLDLEEYVIDIHEINTKILVERVEKLITNHDNYVSQINEKLPIVIRQGEIAMEYIYKSIYEK